MISSWRYKDIVFAYITEEQIAEVVEILHDPEVEEYLYFAPITLAGFRAFTLPLIEGQKTAFQKGDYPASTMYAIMRNGEILGTCGSDLMENAHNAALIGYQLKRSAWGGGVGTAALEFLIHYARTYLNIRKLFGDCMTANVGSSRVMEKCGFTLEGILTEKYEVNGQLHDNSWYGLKVADAAPLPAGAVEEIA